MKSVIQNLESTARGVYKAIVIRSLSLALLLTVPTILIFITTDWLWRTPREVRWVILVLWSIYVLFLIHHMVLPALKCKVNVISLAHLIERRIPKLRGRLVSGLELTLSPTPTTQPNTRAIESIKKSLEAHDCNKLIQPRYNTFPTMATVILLTACVFMSVVFPTPTSTGVIRFFNPTTANKWPARTSLISLTTDSNSTTHAMGTPLILTAENTTPGAENGNIFASYRWYEEEKFGPWVSVLLTNQSDGIHERMLETNTTAVEFYFSTSDAVTDVQSITFHKRPITTTVMLAITPPSTLIEQIPHRTHIVPHSDSYFSKVEPPILRGSFVTLEIQTTNPVESPTPGLENDWCAENIGLFIDQLPLVTNPEPGTTRIQWTMQDSSRLAIQPKDHMGLRANTPLIIDMPIGVDQMPRVVITTPTTDQSVLKSAHIELHASATDDIGLESIGFQLYPIDSPTNTPTTPSWAHEATTDHTSSTLETKLDLEELNPTPGTIYVLHATANDRHTENSGGFRKVVSTPVHIQVVDMTRFLTMLRQNISNIREQFRFIDGQQAELEKIVRIGEWTHEDKIQQEYISKNIEIQHNSLEDIIKELESNNAVDKTIEELINYSINAANQAGHYAATAAYQMELPDTESILISQDSVRSELQTLVEFLGEDETAWVTIRQLERLLEIQILLTNKSSHFSVSHPGLSIEEMTQEQLLVLNTYTEEQTIITEDIDLFLRDLKKNTQALTAVSDPKAAGYETAGTLATSSNPGQLSFGISNDIAAGRLQTAIRNQGLLIKSLQSIHNALTGSNDINTKDLVRKLARIEESILHLIAAQKDEIESISIIPTGSTCPQCGENMLLLRNTTLVVAQELQKTDPALLITQNLLKLAAHQQASAVADIRTTPLNIHAVVLHESNSLEYLNEALLTVVNKIDSVEETFSNTNEFAALYNALADREAELYLSTQGLMEQKINRRAEFEARKIANAQEVIRLELRALVAQQTNSDTSPVLEYAHKQIDTLALKVVDMLVTAGVSERVLNTERSIAVTLRGLAQTFDRSAYQEAYTSSNPHSSNNTPSSHNNPGSTPPLEELVLLKMMQTNILDSTKEYNGQTVRGHTKEMDYLIELANQQSSLAQLTQGVIKQTNANTETPRADITPKAMNDTTTQIQYLRQQPTQTKVIHKLEEFPNLDDLLGTNNIDNKHSTINPEIPINNTPLAVAAAQMQTASIYLLASRTGLETQRLQIEIIHQLDLEIEQAKKSTQQTQGGSGGSQGNTDFGVQSEHDPTGANSNPGEAPQPIDFSPDQNIVLEPLLGGELDNPNSEWGNLPPRVRDQLRQGRQEEYSTIYERMTAEYYRRLARDELHD